MNPNPRLRVPVEDPFMHHGGGEHEGGGHQAGGEHAAAGNETESVQARSPVLVRRA
jgi:hypothetical protein